MVYLLRHGLDDENFIGGWSDVDLTLEGINQVRDSANYIKENLNFSKIYSSDIKRAVTTSKIVSDYTKTDVIYTKNLRELDKGLLTGMDKYEAKKFFPEYFNDLDIYKKYPDGESMLDLYERIKILLNNISVYEDSLLVTHRGVINMIYFIMNDMMPNLDKKQFNVDHASIHELDYSNKKIRKIK